VLSFVLLGVALWFRWRPVFQRGPVGAQPSAISGD
jgi:hypothetical protein